MLDQLIAEEVRLIDAENELLVAGNLSDVFLQVLREVKVWVARVDDLQQHFGLFDDTPKLLPDFDVLLERRNGQTDIVFFNLGEVATPVEERSVLVGYDLLASHRLLPLRPTWDVQRPVLRVIGRVSHKFLDDGSRLASCDCRVADHGVTLLDPLKLFLRKLSQLHELF